MDSIEYGYQNPFLFYLMQVWALTLRESDGALRWMRSELNGDLLGCITFKGCLVGGPPWFGDIEMCPLGFGNDLLLLIYVYMLFMSLIFSMI